MASPDKQLYLRFHGRILEHMGIQTYQSPVNSIAELVANAWDGDAETVEIELPAQLSKTAEIVLRDDGIGMTFEDCQDRYLNVGWNRRGSDPNEVSSKKQRPILGRKGIGKFAGFGIAEVIRVDTISAETGERTEFELDLGALLSEEYITTEGKPIGVIAYEPPSDARKASHGTVVTLRTLTLKQPPSPQQFARSMARRFLLHQRQADFRILVNGSPLPEAFDLAGVEYVFPRDYRSDEKPEGLTQVDSDGWGTEQIASGRSIRWRFLFHKETIDEEELRGIAIFAKGKLAQAPFLFNLTGGLGGQHGVEYLSGQVEADFLDGVSDDLIATERQRVNWEHEESRAVLEWGRARVKKLLPTWRERRGEQRVRELEEKLAGFTVRLDKLQAHEASTVKKALKKLAQVPTLSKQRFEELGDAVLTAWEQGRLRELVARLSEAEGLSEEELLRILVEAGVLTALNVAEAVKTKMLTVAGLKERIQRRELETAVRDYIAQNPWLISPEWETFRVERSVTLLLKDAGAKAGLTGQDWEGRVDLALGSRSHLLILEFMRPGLRINLDHLERFDRYVRTVRVNIEANTAGRFKSVTGYIVADGLESDSVTLDRLKTMKDDGMFALDWPTLFANAVSAWQEFLEILASRAPDDDRLRTLVEGPEKATEGVAGQVEDD